MSFQDFAKNFSKLEICNLGPDSVADESTKKKRYEMTAHEGCWKRRVNAGGCRNYLSQYQQLHHNHRYDMNIAMCSINIVNIYSH